MEDTTSGYSQVLPTSYKDERLNNLQLLPFLDPFLHIPLEEFDFSNPPIDPAELAKALVDTMKATNGVGLSANQVGLPHRVFVYGIKDAITVAFNAKIVGATKEKVAMKEGCLSVPGVWLILSRPEGIVCTFQTETGESKALELNGIAARVFQHEYDHMEGRNFTMLASPLKLERALKALQKKVKHGRK